MAEAFIAAIPDEYPITTIPDIPSWSENYALMASDTEGELALFFGTGRWHGAPDIWRELLVIALPDGRNIFAKGYGRGGDARGPGGACAKFDVLEPGRRFALRYDGPLWESDRADLFDHGFRDGAVRHGTVELTFESDRPVWNMKGDSVAAADIAGAIHIEQIGLTTGTVTYGDERYVFRRGFSIRDHSRGPRDVTRYQGHCWTQGHFAYTDTSFFVYAMALRGVEGLGMANAAVMRAGRTYPAVLRAINMPDSAEATRGLMHLELESDLGIMTIEATRLINHVVTGMVRPYDTIVGGKARHSAAVIVDGPTRLSWNGQEGLGWSERGFAPDPL